MNLIYAEAMVLFFLNKFEAKDQTSKAMPSTNSYETRLTFNIDKWDPQISGTNNQMMQKGFLDLKTHPWVLLISVPIIIMSFISAVYYQKFCLKWKLYSTFIQILISIKSLLIIN